MKALKPKIVGSDQEMNGEKLLSTTESFAIKFLLQIESIIFVH
jgi:hypothetical protein